MKTFKPRHANSRLIEGVGHPPVVRESHSGLLKRNLSGLTCCAPWQVCKS